MDKDNALTNRLKSLTDELSKLRTDDCLTDFTICVDEELIRAHKVVLAANSDFFKAMFDNDSAELRSGMATLKEIDSETMKVIVEFWYTRHMKMTDENICSLLLAASRFQAKTTLEVCLDFAGANLTPDNYLSIALVCERCNFADLKEKAFAYCLQNFSDIIQTSELSYLDQELFTQIISDDRLNVKNEIDVFEAIVNWVRFDETVRSSKLDDLMQEVRFASIDPISLVKLNAKFTGIYEPYRVKAMSILLLKRNLGLCEEYVGKFNMKPCRLASASNIRIYVLGGDNHDVSFEAYDPNSDLWSRLPDVVKPVKEELVVTSPGWDFIYAPSFDGLNFLYYNLRTNRWFSGDCQPFHRTGVELMIALGEHIYCFQGCTGSVFPMYMYMHDLKGTLILYRDCEQKRTDFGFAVHDHFIYLIGGIVETNGAYEATNSVRRYDSLRETWETVAPMINVRSSFGCCSHDGKIYVAGGQRVHGETLDSMREAEVYDPKLNIWMEIKSMTQARRSFKLVESSGQFYAIGGKYLRCWRREVEAYDPDSNEWVQKKPMPIERSVTCTLIANG